MTDKHCVWHYDEPTDSWDTGYGHKFTFTTDGPVENGFEHCYSCGGELVVAPLQGSFNENYGKALEQDIIQY